MAFGMRHWIGVVLVGCALVAAAALPPRPPRIDGRITSSPAERRAAALGSELRRDQELLKRLRWQDSLPSLVVRSATDGVAVNGPPQVPDSVLVTIRGHVLDEKAKLDRSDPGVLFGYVLQPANQSEEPGVHAVPIFSLYDPSPDVMAGEVDGHAYCVEVPTLAERMLDRPDALRRALRYRYLMRPSDLIGVCRPVLRYGLPGPYVSSWLKAGASAFALAEDSTSTERAWRAQWDGASGALRAQWLGSLSPSRPLRACIAGRANACLREALVGRPRDSDGNEEIGTYIQTHSDFFVVPTRGAPPFGFAGAYLLSDLQTEFGPEAFGRFWRSSQEVQPAFHDAFGLDMDSWLMRWTRRNLPTYRPGPSLAAVTAVGLVLLLALCGGVGAVAAAKRSVA